MVLGESSEPLEYIYAVSDAAKSPSSLPLGFFLPS